MQNILDYQSGHYVLSCDPVTARRAQNYGFTRHSSGFWVTQQYDKAKKLVEFANATALCALEAEDNARRMVTAPSYVLSAPAGFSVPAPKGEKYAPYQLAGIKFHIDCFAQNRGAYNCDAMGSGKTIMTVGTINYDESIKRVLVMCPSSVKINWMRELRKWLVRPQVIGFAEPGEPMPVADIVICNYDIASKCHTALINAQWDLIVCDEAHHIKNKDAQRSQAVLSIPSKRSLWLSGTPVENRPREIWTAATTLAPDVFGIDYLWFSERYCDRKRVRVPCKGKKTGRVRTKFKEVWDDSGASNLGELNYKLRSSIMLRREKKDILPFLPKKRRQLIVLPDTGCVRKIKAEKKRWEEVCKAHGYDSAVKAIKTQTGPAFEEMSAVRREVAAAKLKASVAFIRDALVSSRKVVVFCYHRSTVEGLMDALAPFNPVPHHGGLNDTEKDAAIQAFINNPEFRVFIGNIKSAGTGVDGLQKVCDHAIFAELDWRSASIEQAEDRLHRSGQTGSVLIQHLVLDNSLDNKMIGDVLDKKMLVNQITI